MKAVHIMFFLYSSSTNSGQYEPLAARTRKGIVAELRALRRVENGARLPLEYEPGAESAEPDTIYVTYLATAIYSSITAGNEPSYVSVPHLVGQDGYISSDDLARFIAVKHHILPSAAKRLVSEGVASLEAAGHTVDMRRIRDDHAETIMEHLESCVRRRAMDTYKEGLEWIRIACAEIVTGKEENPVAEHKVQAAIRKLADAGVPLNLIAWFTPNSQMVNNRRVTAYGTERALRLNPFYDLVAKGWTYDFYEECYE